MILHARLHFRMSRYFLLEPTRMVDHPGYAIVLHLDLSL